jgi:hypothetical protein
VISEEEPLDPVLRLPELLGECERLRGLGVEEELVALGPSGVVEVERNRRAVSPERVAGVTDQLHAVESRHDLIEGGAELRRRAALQQHRGRVLEALGIEWYLLRALRARRAEDLREPTRVRRKLDLGRQAALMGGTPELSGAEALVRDADTISEGPRRALCAPRLLVARADELVVGPKMDRADAARAVGRHPLLDLRRHPPPVVVDRLAHLEVGEAPGGGRAGRGRGAGRLLVAQVAGVEVAEVDSLQLASGGVIGDELAVTSPGVGDDHEPTVDTRRDERRSLAVAQFESLDGARGHSQERVASTLVQHVLRPEQSRPQDDHGVLVEAFSPALDAVSHAESLAEPEIQLGSPRLRLLARHVELHAGRLSDDSDVVGIADPVRYVVVRAQRPAGRGAFVAREPAGKPARQVVDGRTCGWHGVAACPEQHQGAERDGECTARSRGEGAEAGATWRALVVGGNAGELGTEVIE